MPPLHAVRFGSGGLHGTGGSRRLPRPLRALALAGVTLAVLATLGAPGALANPPVGTTGGWLELIPTHARATAQVNANYWFVPTFTPCPATVAFLWDAKPVQTVATPPGWNCGTVALVFSFLPPTTATTGHRVTACDPAGKCVTQTYTIDPTPTLKLSPTKGLATASFDATYSTGQTTCGYASAQFLWDGKASGAEVPLDATCTAVRTFKPVPVPNGAGAHQVAALACTAPGACRFLRVNATFTVNPKATPTPTPTPRLTPRPTPTPAPTATASPTPSATPSPSPTPVLLTPPPRPTPAVPTASLAASPTPTSNPIATPATGGGAIPPPGGGPIDGGGNAYVPAIVGSLDAPDPGGIDAAVVGTNVFLTFLFVFLFLLTTEIFNSTMDANRDEIHGWWMRVFGRPIGFVNGLTVSGSSLSRLSGSGRLGSVLRVLAVLALLGFIYGFLSPDFGLNQQSLILFVSLVVGLGFLTLLSEGSMTRLARRRYHATASVKLYGTAILVAVLAVVISRLLTFSPGLVYGFIASAVIVTPVALAKRDDATLVLLPAIALIVVGVAAWALLGPVRVAAASGAPGPALAESVLGMLEIGGLEGVFFMLLPLTFLDGAAVMNWSRAVWALAFGTVVFLWWQLLLNRDASYAGALEQTNVRIVLVTLGVWMLSTGLFWSYFRFRPSPPEVEAEAEV
jgi:hypothetical protein